MSITIPGILEKLRYVDLKEISHIELFLIDLKEYQQKLAKDLEAIDGKKHGLDDLLPALEKDLKGFIDLKDKEKILDIFDFCMAGKLNDKIELNGEYIYALTNLWSIANFIVEIEKQRNAIFVLSQSLAKGMQILDKTRNAINKLSEKEPQKYSQPLTVLNDALTKLTELKSATESMIDSDELPPNYFKTSFIKFHTIMANARNQIDDRSSLRKIFDEVCHMISRAVNRALRSINMFANKTGFFDRTVPAKNSRIISEIDTQKAAFDVVEMKMLEDLEEEDISIPDYNEIPKSGMK